MIGGELQSGLVQRLDGLAEKQPADDWRHAVSARVGKGEKAAKAMDLGRVNTYLFAGHAPGRDRNRKDHARLDELILIGKVLDPLLIDGHVKARESPELLLDAELENMLLVGQHGTHPRLSLQNCER